MKIVLATGNQGKIKELQYRLGDHFDLIAQSDLGVIAPPETGLTFVENALIKARAAAEQTGLPCIADDSGLAVDHLKGAPGIRSARFAGETATDTENNAKLLASLDQVPTGERSARFHCALVYLRHAADPTPIICQGTWEGRILDAPSGNGGFGYDPLFFALDQHCAAAELTPEIKNKVSHRGIAMDSLAEQFDN